jgi:LAO/AO transport system kinase
LLNGRKLNLVQDKIKQLLSDIQTGNQRALARGISLVENELEGYEALLSSLQYTDATRVIGITGPPGAGKSTLVNGLIAHWTALDKRLAIIAVDPSSPFNYGALLGDRIRMGGFYTHPNVFIRSLASRGALGGLNGKILEITDLVKNAPYDYILVETVGVGQSEVEIAGLADCTVVVLVPEAGDEVQTLKAGIMEIADIFVINKSDRDTADAFFRHIKTMVHERSKDGIEVPVLKTIASRGEGLAELSMSIDQFFRSGTQDRSSHKLNLLLDKSWQLIQSNKMKGINKRDLKKRLEVSLSQPHFNMYNFVNQIVNKQT